MNDPPYITDASFSQVGGPDDYRSIERRDDVTYAGLVVNERGYDRLVESGLDEVHVAFAATDEFNERNAGMSTEDGVRMTERILARAAEDGIRAASTISAGIPL